MSDRPSTRICTSTIVSYEIINADATAQDITSRMDESGLCAANRAALQGSYLDIKSYQTLRTEMARFLYTARSMRVLNSGDFCTNVPPEAEIMAHGFSVTELLKDGANIPQALAVMSEANKIGATNEGVSDLISRANQMKALWIKHGKSESEAETMLGTEIAAMGMAINSRERDMELSSKHQAVGKSGRKPG
jgi:hypothetical protein